MRPLKRATEPKKFKKYDEAKPYLVDNFGGYCSYCERYIPTFLAVEHIQPKGLDKYEHLREEWTNFLLGCANCNGAKTDKDVELDKYFLPDRDNTFVPFMYDEDGKVSPSAGLNAARKKIAEDTIELCALNKYHHPNWNEAALQGVLERWGQRVAAIKTAKESLSDYEAAPSTPHARNIARCAAAKGFFSIWMQVFFAHPEVRREIIAAHPGTSLVCFDTSTLPASPRPNDHNLSNGGKV